MAFIDQVHEAAYYLKKQVKNCPRHAILLGTGLKDIVHKFKIQAAISLEKIPHFPQMTVNHMDAFLYAVECEEVSAWILGGRLHYYEGYTMPEVTFPIRVLAEAGTQSFFFTNAAGNVNPTFSAGDLLLIRDHINWSFPSPLIGQNNADWGNRYPEMTDIYDPIINEKLQIYAHQSGIQLDTGIYLGLTGPQLETPAEYRLFHQLGADMVGMSTIPEVIVAAHMNRRVIALSILSNDAVNKPKKGSTDIKAILGSIKGREDDVEKLIRYWLEL